MNATQLSRVTRIARTAAVLLTLGLFTIGSVPATGQAFPGALHWVAHLGAYALIACAFGLGWPLRPAALVAAFVAAIGAIHEGSEIFTHSHVFETADAIVNAIGALIGVAMQRVLQRTVGP